MDLFTKRNTSSHTPPCSRYQLWNDYSFGKGVSMSLSQTVDAHSGNNNPYYYLATQLCIKIIRSLYQYCLCLITDNRSILICMLIQVESCMCVTLEWLQESSGMPTPPPSSKAGVLITHNSFPLRHTALLIIHLSLRLTVLQLASPSFCLSLH